MRGGDTSLWDGVSEACEVGDIHRETYAVDGNSGRHQSHGEAGNDPAGDEHGDGGRAGLQCSAQHCQDASEEHDGASP